MKNHYLKFGTLFCILVFVIFIAAGVFYTRSLIDEFNEEIYRGVIEIYNGTLFRFDEGSEDMLEKEMQQAWDRYFDAEYAAGSGFYSSLADSGNGSIMIDSSDYTASSDKTNAELDETARNICDEYASEYIASGNMYSSYESDKGTFQTSIISVHRLNSDKTLLTCCAVFNPLSSVIRINAGTYIVAILIFFIAEAAVSISFVMLYRNQKNFELRNQKMTRGIAHELKTPLAVTKATVENWEYLDEDKRHEYSENIITEVDHMSDMINKLLEVSKINGGNVKMNREEVDLLKLTRELQEKNNELIRERNIRFSLTGDENSYPVYADHEMMEIVIGNFISNAIKYCDHTITVSFERAGKKISFSITNDGAKIDKKDLDKIWDVFYTTDKSRTDRMSNSGVGLSLVKSILDAHKAKYGCTSGATGTTFRFSMDSYADANK